MFKPRTSHEHSNKDMNGQRQPSLVMREITTVFMQRLSSDYELPTQALWSSFCLRVSDGVSTFSRGSWTAWWGGPNTASVFHPWTQKFRSPPLRTQCCQWFSVDQTVKAPFTSVQCCFTSTETVRTIRDGEPRTATSTSTQLLSSASSMVHSAGSIS